MLAAMAASAAAAGIDAADEAEGAAASAAMDALLIASAPVVNDEAGFVGFLFHVNRLGWRTIALLWLSVHMAYMTLYVLYIRHEPSSAALLARGALSRKQVRDLRFYDPHDLSLPPTTVLDYKWSEVQAAAPLYVAWTMCVHMPTHLCILVCIWSKRLRPFVRRWYEPLFGVISMLQLCTYIFMDAYILHVTGRVPRYAFADCAMHALGVFWFHCTGPFRLTCSNLSVVVRAFVTFGICVWTRAWGMLLWPGNAVQVLGLIITFMLGPRQDRSMRKRYAEHVAATAAAAAEPAAQGKVKSA